ncbi:MAG: ABC transporter permease, partial [Clostridiales Family XIII bacterium]|nr:ABC transporter permease [Clostridiales Family XIII bacterium]
MVTTPFRSMLFRKMLRDVLHQKTQFISVLLMAFLALFIYAGVGAEWHGLQRSADDFYAQTNLADVMIYGGNFSEEQAARVRALPSVRAVEPRLEAAGTAALDGAPKMQLSFFGTGAISGFYLCAGSAFDREDTDGIWLSERFAGAHHLELGDSIEIQMGPLSLSKTIRGLVHSPEQVFQTASETLSADFEANGFAYLASGAFPMPESFDWNTLLIDADISDAADLAVTDTGRLSALEDEISEVLDGRYTTFLAQKDHPSVSMFRNEIAQHKMMGDIFPVVFVLIALLTMMTTMTRVVNNQRIQIGTLKAMGFKRGEIMRHYVSYGLVLPLLGAALGLVLGPLTLPQLFYPAMSSFYTLPEWKPAFDSSFLLVALAVVAFCALITYRAAAKVLGDTPADTLRPKAPKTRARNSAERGRFWNKLRFHTQWNIRDTFRNPIRSC